jgi:hypothetical protein
MRVIPTAYENGETRRVGNLLPSNALIYSPRFSNSGKVRTRCLGQHRFARRPAIASGAAPVEARARLLRRRATAFTASAASSAVSPPAGKSFLFA